MALPKVTSLAVYASQTSGVSEIAMAVFSFTIAVLGTIGSYESGCDCFLVLQPLYWHSCWVVSDFGTIL